MTERRRYFMMGNALVVGIIERLGEYLEEIFDKEE
jgi:DNA (cytosine-5)-methyltransferase 1